MTNNMRCIIRLGALVCLAAFMSGCATVVLKQDIPVSTNPLGAKIYANGQLVGLTPATVSLERNRSHVLTLVKENYRQEDVSIINRYQKEKVYMKAIQSGLNSGLFFKNASMGVGSSMSSLSYQEDSGEAYLLYPPTVTVMLTPLNGAAPTGSSTKSFYSYDNPASAPPGDVPMDDREMAKELLKTGVGAAATQMRPLEKRATTSSSTKSYVKPDGTRVTEKSSSSVGVSVNPAGLVDVIDTLFK